MKPPLDPNSPVIASRGLCDSLPELIGALHIAQECCVRAGMSREATVYTSLARAKAALIDARAAAAVWRDEAEGQLQLRLSSAQSFVDWPKSS